MAEAARSLRMLPPCPGLGGTAIDAAEVVCPKCGHDRSTNFTDAPEKNPLFCARCDRKLDFVGTKQFHEGTRAWDFLGGIWELLKCREHYDVYVCKRFGRLEFFVDGLGEDLRGEPREPGLVVGGCWPIAGAAPLTAKVSVSNMTTFRQLEGLPAYGPMATGFPEEWARLGREGLVVEFAGADGATWVGNFRPGLCGLDDVRRHPNGNQVLVCSGHANNVTVRPMALQVSAQRTALRAAADAERWVSL